MRGLPCAFLGHSNASKIALMCDFKKKKIFWAMYLKLDRQFASTPTHVLPLGIKNQLSPLACQQLPDMPFNTVEDHFSLFDSTDRYDVILSLPSEDTPLHINVIDDEDFHVPLLKSISKRHMWCHFLVSSFKSNCWIVSIHDEESISAEGAREATRFLISKGHHEVKFTFCKRQS